MGVFSVGDIFVSILCLLMCIFFYLIGNSKRLEKIKKYGERLMGEIKELADSVRLPLENFKIDLEVETKAAEQLLSRLKDVRTTISEYEDATKQIEEGLEQFKTLLSGLNGESVVVAENLLRIRDESAFVDGLSQRIISAQKRFDMLEREISHLKEAMLNTFEKTNADNLEKSVTSLLSLTQETTVSLQNEMEQRMNALTKTADEAKKCVELHLNLIQEAEKGQQSIIKESKEEIIRLAKDAVKIAEEHSDKYEIQLFQKLHEEIDQRVAAARERIDSDWEIIQKVSLENHTNISLLSEESRLAISKINEELESVKVNVRDTIVRTATEEEALWYEKLNNIKGEFGLFSEYAEKLEERVKIIQEHINDTAGKIEAAMKKSLDDATENAARLGDDKFNQYRTVLEERFDVTKSKFDLFSKRTVELEGQIEVMQGQVDKMTEKIEETLKESLENAVENAAQLGDKKFDAYRIVLEEKLNTARSEIDQFAEHALEVEERVNTMREQIGGTIINFEETLRKSFEEAAQDAERLGNEKFDMYHALLEEKLNTTKNEVSQFVTYTTEMEERVKATQEQISGMAEKIEETLGKSLENAVENATRLGDGKFDTYRAALEEKLSTIKNEFDQFADYATKIDGRVTAVREQIGGVIEKFEETLRESLEKAAQDAGNFGDARFNDYRATLEEKLKAAEDEINLFTEHTKEVEGQVNTMREQVGNVVEKIEETLRESLEKAAQDAGKFGDEKFDRYRATLEEKLGAAKGEIDRFAEHAAETEGRVKAIREEIGGVIENFEETMKESLEKAVQDAGKFGDEKFSTYHATLEEKLDVARNEIDQFAERASEVEGQVNAMREQVGGVAENIEKTLKESLVRAAEDAKKLGDERFHDYRAALEEKLGAARNEIDRFAEHAAEMENRVEAIREQVGGVIENFEETLKESLEKAAQDAGKFGDEKFSTYHAALEEKLGAARNEIDQFAEHASEVEGRIQAMREQVDGVAENIEKTLKGSLEEAVREAERLGDERFNAYRAALEEKLNAARNEIDQFAEHASEMEGRVQAMREHIGGTVKDFEETLKESLEKAAQDAGELGDEKFNNYRAALEEKLGVARNEIDQFAKHVAEIDGQVNVMRQQIGGAVENFKEILRESLENAAKGATEDAGKLGDEKFDTYRAVLEEKISTFSMDADKKLQETNNSLSAMIERLNTLVQNTGEEMSESVAVMKAGTDKARADIESLTTELEALKEEAAANLNDKISSLEESVTASLYDKIETLKSIQEAEYTKFDAEIADKYQTAAKETGEKWTSKFERLREKLEAFENTLRGEMNSADENFSAYRNNIEQNMEDLRKNAEMVLKNEMEKIAQEASKTLHTSRRELDDGLKTLSTDVQGRIEDARVLIEETSVKSEKVLRETNEKIETTMQKIASLDAEIQNVQKEIDDFPEYAKLFEQAGNLKIELEHKIEDMKADIERLIQEKNALAGMEMQFEKVRRIEEDVSAKITRFLAEQKRIDIMESDFNRLVKMSSDIEEKLKGISAENEMLEQVQLKIRRLYEAAESSEEKYQRVEKRSNIIETTNAGISANFKKLDEAERQIETHKADMANIEKDISSVKEALAKIKFDNNEALKISKELSVLDTSLTEIEGRINRMQTAREWLAGIETRMNEMYRNTIENLNRIDENSKRSLGSGRGKVDVLSPSLRDEVRRLKQEGWRVETIARNLGISEGEVQLILEVSAR